MKIGKSELLCFATLFLPVSAGVLPVNSVFSLNSFQPCWALAQVPLQHMGGAGWKLFLSLLCVTCQEPLSTIFLSECILRCPAYGFWSLDAGSCTPLRVPLTACSAVFFKDSPGLLPFP